MNVGMRVAGPGRAGPGGAGGGGGGGAAQLERLARRRQRRRADLDKLIRLYASLKVAQRERGEREREGGRLYGAQALTHVCVHV